MRKHLLLYPSAVIAACAIVCSATPNVFAASINASDNVVTQWNDAMLEAVRQTRAGPPMVARMSAILNTCAFDAWAAYDERARATRSGRLLKVAAARRTSANKSEAISYAAYRALNDLFPQASMKPLFDATLTQQGYSPTQANLMDRSTNAGVGNTACKLVLDFRHKDGSNQLGDLNGGAPYSDYTGYQPVNTPDQINDPSRWQPLRTPNGSGGYVEQKFMAPQWGRVIPFALRNPDRTIVEPARSDVKQLTGHVGPMKVTDPDFLDEAETIAMYNAVLTDSQKSMAEYWADGPKSETPPGHWILLSKVVSLRDHHTLDQDVKLFFAVSNTEFDASIAVWGAKVKFDSVRPVTAIHYLFAGRVINSAIGPVLGEAWQPYQAPTFVTPPFAEYPSGHSAFSAAAAEILKRFTGSDVFGGGVVVAAGSSQFEAGIPAHDVALSWATFTDAADEAALSRRYGGIHFVDGDLDSRVMGRRVAEYTWPAIRYFYGEVPTPFHFHDDH